MEYGGSVDGVREAFSDCHSGFSGNEKYRDPKGKSRKTSSLSEVEYDVDVDFQVVTYCILFELLFVVNLGVLLTVKNHNIL